MSPVLTRPRQPQSRPAQRRRDMFTAAVAIVLGTAVLIGLAAALRGPHVIDRVTIVNDSPYVIDVEITSQTRDGWLALGPVSPGDPHTFESVIDQGDRWVFHATSGTTDGGEFSLSKTQLEHAHWRATIPEDVQSRLEANGAQSPPHP